MYTEPVTPGGGLAVIVEVLVVLVDLSTTNKIVAAVWVSTLPHHAAASTMKFPLQVEQLAEACDAGPGDRLMAASGGISVMPTAAPVSRASVDPSGFY